MEYIGKLARLEHKYILGPALKKRVFLGSLFVLPSKLKPNHLWEEVKYDDPRVKEAFNADHLAMIIAGELQTLVDSATHKTIWCHMVHTRVKPIIKVGKSILLLHNLLVYRAFTWIAL